MKTKADILNAIPSGMDLETYFDSLTVFQKRELINELEVSKSHFANNIKPKAILVLFSYACSFLCYFGIKENWFAFYLICLNVPLSIFFFLDIKEYSVYDKAVKKLEIRLSK